ncbi:polar amino acid transport system substrate-binding protein [Roseibium hamelinense]|uniref:Polar amino acid transport system substrate-binding protein n=1 Tax=Roseibium hamelinense TaxID=150831 RepID=A0A562TI02_9HYPH|nr:transporter substrate-binding domain-containing protein [Roseibium hamelinense]MTI42641.1 transporter substrate-binding domain-containing protein [Roseibium hamelinense]TWI93265.1 polar amino acid transport system substrate-binding protein [Roseibium hamelinense]
MNPCRNVVLVWLLCFVLPVSASKADEYLIVTGTGYPPYVDITLEKGGMVTEIVEQIFANAANAASYELVLAPWTRGYQLSKEGKFIGTFPYIWSQERAQDFLFSDPILDGHQKFFARRDSSIVFDGPESLTGSRVCSPRGYEKSLFRAWEAEGYIVVDEPGSLQDCFKMIALGRTHLVPLIEEVGMFVLNNTRGVNSDDFTVLEPPIRDLPHYFIVSKRLPDAEQHLETFNKGLRELRKSGKLDEIMQRHIGRGPS